MILEERKEKVPKKKREKKPNNSGCRRAVKLQIVKIVIHHTLVSNITDC